MAEKDKKEATEGKKLNLALIGQIAFAVMNLSVLGLGAFWTYSATIGWHPPQITEAQLSEEANKDDEAGTAPIPLVYTMDKFTVNLQGVPPRTMQVEINLEMQGKDGFEEVIGSDSRARARDRILEILGRKSLSEIETVQGKLKLKDQIHQELNDLLERGVVKDVYFTEFVVQ